MKHMEEVMRLEQQVEVLKAADLSLDKEQATVHVKLQRQVKSCSDILNV